MKLNVMYSTDENYAQHCGVSMISLFEKNKNFNEINVYLVECNLKYETKEKLSQIVSKFNRTINFIDIKKLCNHLNKSDDFPLAAYARLFIDQVKEVDKILYLDCDTIISDSLQELWNLDMQNHYIAGVQDNVANFAVKAIGMTSKDRYVNSGVLLFNLSLWRSDNLSNKFLNFIDNYNGAVPHHDQGILNGVCKDRILILNPIYNVMPETFYLSGEQIKKLYHLKNYYSQKELDNAKEHPVIIHYITKYYNRPWFIECTHPQKDLYIKYLQKSPWNMSLQHAPLNRGVEFRKKIFRSSPFFVYNFLEQVLYIKRYIAIRRIYKKKGNCI